MLGVLKDPQGETVFTAHEEALQVISALGELPDSEFVRLRKKVQEMESAIVAYKVSKQNSYGLHHCITS